MNVQKHILPLILQKITLKYYSLLFKHLILIDD
jgi:hypothetical protein